MTLTTTAEPVTAGPPAKTPTVGRLSVEYWTVAMDGQDSCGSCDATLTAVTDAIDAVRPVAERLGLAIEVAPRAVSTWAEALQHRIVASPTIRAEGLELTPSHQDESETRQWHWRGGETASTPFPAVVDLLVQALAARSRAVSDYLTNGGPAPYVRRYLQTAPAAEPSATGAASCGTSSGCG
ncbi:DUF2703 domain-containing protein [Natronosporangium hydrolyticum]|uniref:DUF2703 domain-containing protein n=1 Tax=Natronosporangium hydrolyticum TaxID=2811111 RepID=A0A895YKE4_9ACTN|nr:DUF2703 domain-containing protein [Natronosporangium hydrolyticum]QSB15969.1 DUF2703 domain-containing protein [Natronosporangium hydrolyticum]